VVIFYLGVNFMNAHKLAATLMEDGNLVLKGLPFHAGDTVEIIILEQPKEQSASPPQQTEYPLQGKQPLMGRKNDEVKNYCS
jgi:hypothetical protein